MLCNPVIPNDAKTLEPIDFPTLFVDSGKVLTAKTKTNIVVIQLHHECSVTVIALVACKS